MPPKRATRAASAAKPTTKVASTRASRSNAKQEPTQHQTSYAPQNDAEILSAFRLFAVSRDQLSEAEDEEEDDDDESGEGVIKVPDIRRCLTALNLPKPPRDFFEPDQTYLSWRNFLALASTLRDNQSLPRSSSPLSSAPDNSNDSLDEASESDVVPVKRTKKKSSATTAATSSKAKGIGKGKAAGKRRAGALDDEDDEGEQRSTEEEIAHAFALFTHNRYGNGDDAHAQHKITLADLKRVARELREDVDEKVLRTMIEEANGGSERGSVEKGVGKAEFEAVMRRAGVFG